MRRIFLFGFFSLCLAAPAVAQEAVRPDPSAPATMTAAAPATGNGATPAASDPAHAHRQQRDHYLWGTFGPPGLLGAALSSGFQQVRGVPSEWGRSRTGLAKRFAAEYAESAVGDTTKYVLARLFDGDPSFRPCECTGLLPRLRHASLSPFTARKDDGRTVFSIARAAGLTTGHVASAALWYPTHQAASGVAEHVVLDLAAKAGVDIMREFLWRKRGCQ
jgi:hypothetical protein